MTKSGMNKPDLVTYEIRIRKIFHVNIEITENRETGEWSWTDIELSPGKLDRDEIIAKIVDSKYPENTRLRLGLEPESLEYEIMLAWKKQAEKIANEAIKFVKEKGLW